MRLVRPPSFVTSAPNAVPVEAQAELQPERIVRPAGQALIGQRHWPALASARPPAGIGRDVLDVTVTDRGRRERLCPIENRDDGAGALHVAFERERGVERHRRGEAALDEARRAVRAQRGGGRVQQRDQSAAVHDAGPAL